MSNLHYKSIAGKAPEIIDDVLAQPEFMAEPELAFPFHLVVDEIVSNIVNYAYADGSDGELSVTIDSEEHALCVSFKDKGIPFNPLEQKEPDVTLSIKERPIGGLGIFLVKKMMDEVAYRYEEGCNILTIKKQHKK